MSKHQPPPAVIQGSFAEFKTVKTRRVAQFIIEVPIEQATAALNTLGGVPNPDTETPVAIARLNETSANPAPVGDAGQSHPAPASPSPDPEPARERRRFTDLPLAQQAAIRCGEPAFWRFLAERHAGRECIDAVGAADTVRRLCRVTSRRELDYLPDAGQRWRELEAGFWSWQRGYER